MDAIPVAVSGFTWSAAGIWTIIVGGIVAWVKTRPRLREIETGSDASLRADLLKRVETLERRLDEERALHEAQIAIMRHRLNNSDQCIDALLMLLETSPDKVSEAVAMIKEMRIRQREAEAVERAAFHAAKITTPMRSKP